MDTGCHFALNQTSSRLQEGAFFFDYLGIEPDEIDGDFYYPVYLVFTQDGVRFYLQHCQLDEKGKVVDHFSGSILFLPMNLDQDFRTELSMTLDAAYDMPLPDVAFKKGKCSPFGTVYFSSRASISPIRRLFLDFLYEMEHGNVFQNDPLYDEVYATLHEHYLYNAIVAKAEYHYYRDMVDGDRDNPIAVDYLVRAERRWIEVITDHRSDLVFHESKWFDEAVDEMAGVYLNARSGLDIVRKSRKENPSVAILKLKSRQSANMAIRWFMDKYRPDGALCVGCGKLYKVAAWGMMLSLLAISFVFIIHGWTAGLRLGVLKEKSIFIWAIWALTVIFFSFFLIPTLRIGRDRKTVFRALFSVMIPRLFAAIAAGWMTVGLGDVIAKIDDGASLEVIPYAPMLGYVASIVIVFLILFLWYSVSQILPFISVWRSLLISVCLCILAFTYSVVIGAGMMHLFGGKSFLMPDDPGYVRVLLVFSFVSMFVGVFIQLLFQDKSISSSDL